jgi:enoyl-CoA hydratase/carnithine racemase
MSEGSGELIVERTDRVAVLTLNRPAAGNSLTPGLILELGDALAEAREDPTVSVIVITGSGDRAFCAGTDLRGSPDGTAHDDQFGPAPQHLSRGMEIWKPIIAAINGYAIGGGFELALSCDLRYAATSATFALPEVRLGTMPGAGGTQRLVRQAPFALAMELLLLGDRWGADRVRDAGLLNGVCEPGALMSTVLDVAGKIAQNAPLSVKAIKQAVARGRHLELGEALGVERTLFNLLRDTEDRQEGRAAFAEKRAPDFHGR